VLIEEVMRTPFVRVVSGLFEVHLNTLADPRMGIRQITTQNDR